MLDLTLGQTHRLQHMGQNAVMAAVEGLGLQRRDVDLLFITDQLQQLLNDAVLGVVTQAVRQSLPDAPR